MRPTINLDNADSLKTEYLGTYLSKNGNNTLSHILFQENAFENVVCKMIAIYFSHRCVTIQGMSGQFQPVLLHGIYQICLDLPCVALSFKLFLLPIGHFMNSIHTKKTMGNVGIGIGPLDSPVRSLLCHVFGFRKNVHLINFKLGTLLV